MSAVCSSRLPVFSPSLIGWDDRQGDEHLWLLDGRGFRTGSSLYTGRIGSLKPVHCIWQTTTFGLTAVTTLPHRSPLIGPLLLRCSPSLKSAFQNSPSASHPSWSSPPTQTTWRAASSAGLLMMSAVMSQRNRWQVRGELTVNKHVTLFLTEPMISVQVDLWRGRRHGSWWWAESNICWLMWLHPGEKVSAGEDRISGPIGSDWRPFFRVKPAAASSQIRFSSSVGNQWNVLKFSFVLFGLNGFSPKFNVCRGSELYFEKTVVE